MSLACEGCPKVPTSADVGGRQSALFFTNTPRSLTTWRKNFPSRIPASGRLSMTRDFSWASLVNVWHLHEDGHVVRYVTDQAGRTKVIYLCNEVFSRYRKIPLSLIKPPKPR